MLSTAGVVLLKGLVGGLVVVVFALIGEVTRPRGLAGIFAAAPSVAVAGLGVTAIVEGAQTARLQALGMIAGAAALLVVCLVGAESVKRLGALKGSVVSTAVWFVVAFSLWAAHQ